MRPGTATLILVFALGVFVSLGLGVFGDLGRSLFLVLILAFIVLIAIDYLALVLSASSKVERPSTFDQRSVAPPAFDSSKTDSAEDICLAWEEGAQFGVENELRSSSIKTQLEIKALQRRLSCLGDPSYTVQRDH